MTANQTTTQMQIEGSEMLLRLFETAKQRLLRKNIELIYDSSAILWLLNQSGWRQSLNSLRTLDGDWHHQIGNRIEKLLLEGRLLPGSSLSIEINPAHSEFEFRTL